VAIAVVAVRCEWKGIGLLSSSERISVEAALANEFGTRSRRCWRRCGWSHAECALQQSIYTVSLYGPLRPETS